MRWLISLIVKVSNWSMRRMPCCKLLILTPNPCSRSSSAWLENLSSLA